MSPDPRLASPVVPSVEEVEPAPPGPEGDFLRMVGCAPAMRRLYAEIDVLAPSDLPVLIQGATGTGKEAVAKALHARGDRRDRTFLPFNCGGVTEDHISDQLFGHERGSYTGAHEARPGLFEAADGGTLFLDEVGDLPVAQQVRLLRVLQEGEVLRLGCNQPRHVDVRIVAATHQPLLDAVDQGRFREDLFFRLSVGRLEVPLLAERIEDLPRLARHFLREHAAPGPAYRLEPNVWNKLLSHAYPGNVRELESVVQVAMARRRQERVIRAEDISFTRFVPRQAANEPPPPGAEGATTGCTSPTARSRCSSPSCGVGPSGGTAGTRLRRPSSLGLGRTTLRNIER